MAVAVRLLGEAAQQRLGLSKQQETTSFIESRLRFWYRHQILEALPSDRDIFKMRSRPVYLVCRVANTDPMLATGDVPFNGPLECFYVQSGAGTNPGTGGAFEIPFAIWATPESIIERLDYLASLPADWNGEGIAQVSPFTVNRTRSLLKVAYLVAEGRLPLPFVSPAYNGMLVVEWTTPSGKELILDVPPSPDDNPGFLLVEHLQSGEESETDGEIGDTWSIEEVIRRFVAN